MSDFLKKIVCSLVMLSYVGAIIPAQSFQQLKKQGEVELDYYLDRAERERNAESWESLAEEGLLAAMTIWENSLLENKDNEELNKEKTLAKEEYEKTVSNRYAEWYSEKYISENVKNGSLFDFFEELHKAANEFEFDGSKIIKNEGDNVKLAREQWDKQKNEIIKKFYMQWEKENLGLGTEISERLNNLKLSDEEKEKIVNENIDSYKNYISNSFNSSAVVETNELMEVMLYDHNSLRNKTDKEAAEIIGEEIARETTLDTSEKLNSQLNDFQQHLSNEKVGDLELYANDWYADFEKELTKSLEKWNSAERSFLRARSEWEQSASKVYIHNEEVWQKAFANLEKRKQKWFSDMQKSINSVIKELNNRGEEIELAIEDNLKKLGVRLENEKKMKNDTVLALKDTYDNQREMINITVKGIENWISLWGEKYNGLYFYWKTEDPKLFNKIFNTYGIDKSNVDKFLEGCLFEKDIKSELFKDNNGEINESLLVLERNLGKFKDKVAKAKSFVKYWNDTFDSFWTGGFYKFWYSAFYNELEVIKNSSADLKSLEYWVDSLDKNAFGNNGIKNTLRKILENTGASSTDEKIDDIDLIIIKAEALLDYWSEEKTVSEAVFDYSKNLTATVETLGTTKENLKTATEEYNKAKLAYNKAVETIEKKYGKNDEDKLNKEKAYKEAFEAVEKAKNEMIEKEVLKNTFENLLEDKEKSITDLINKIIQIGKNRNVNGAGEPEPEKDDFKDEEEYKKELQAYNDKIQLHKDEILGYIKKSQDNTGDINVNGEKYYLVEYYKALQKEADLSLEKDRLKLIKFIEDGGTPKKSLIESYLTLTITENCDLQFKSDNSTSSTDVSSIIRDMGVFLTTKDVERLNSLLNADGELITAKNAWNNAQLDNTIDPSKKSEIKVEFDKKKLEAESLILKIKLFCEEELYKRELAIDYLKGGDGVIDSWNSKEEYNNDIVKYLSLKEYFKFGIDKDFITDNNIKELFKLFYKGCSSAFNNYNNYLIAVETLKSSISSVQIPASIEIEINTSTSSQTDYTVVEDSAINTALKGDFDFLTQFFGSNTTCKIITHNVDENTQVNYFSIFNNRQDGKDKYTCYKFDELRKLICQFNNIKLVIGDYTINGDMSITPMDYGDKKIQIIDICTFLKDSLEGNHILKIEEEAKNYYQENLSIRNAIEISKVTYDKATILKELDDKYSNYVVISDDNRNNINKKNQLAATEILNIVDKIFKSESENNTVFKITDFELVKTELLKMLKEEQNLSSLGKQALRAYIDEITYAYALEFNSTKGVTEGEAVKEKINKNTEDVKNLSKEYSRIYLEINNIFRIVDDYIVSEVNNVKCYDFEAKKESELNKQNDNKRISIINGIKATLKNMLTVGSFCNWDKGDEDNKRLFNAVVDYISNLMLVFNVTELNNFGENKELEIANEFIKKVNEKRAPLNRDGIKDKVESLLIETRENIMKFIDEKIVAINNIYYINNQYIKSLDTVIFDNISDNFKELSKHCDKNNKDYKNKLKYNNRFFSISCTKDFSMHLAYKNFFTSMKNGDFKIAISSGHDETSIENSIKEAIINISKVKSNLKVENNRKDRHDTITLLKAYMNSLVNFTSNSSDNPVKEYLDSVKTYDDALVKYENCKKDYTDYLDSYNKEVDKMNNLYDIVEEKRVNRRIKEDIYFWASNTYLRSNTEIEQSNYVSPEERFNTVNIAFTNVETALKSLNNVKDKNINNKQQDNFYDGEKKAFESAYEKYMVSVLYKYEISGAVEEQEEKTKSSKDVAGESFDDIILNNVEEIGKALKNNSNNSSGFNNLNFVYIDEKGNIKLNRIVTIRKEDEILQGSFGTITANNSSYIDKKLNANVNIFPLENEKPKLIMGEGLEVSKIRKEAFDWFNQYSGQKKDKDELYKIVAASMYLELLDAESKETSAKKKKNVLDNLYGGAISHLPEKIGEYDLQDDFRKELKNKLASFYKNCNKEELAKYLLYSEMFTEKDTLQKAAKSYLLKSAREELLENLKEERDGYKKTADDSFLSAKILGISSAAAYVSFLVVYATELAVAAASAASIGGIYRNYEDKCNELIPKHENEIADFGTQIDELMPKIFDKYNKYDKAVADYHLEARILYNMEHGNPTKKITYEGFEEELKKIVKNKNSLIMNGDKIIIPNIEVFNEALKNIDLSNPDSEIKDYGLSNVINNIVKINQNKVYNAEIALNKKLGEYYLVHGGDEIVDGVPIFKGESYFLKLINTNDCIVDSKEFDKLAERLWGKTETNNTGVRRVTEYEKNQIYSEIYKKYASSILDIINPFKKGESVLSERKQHESDMPNNYSLDLLSRLLLQSFKKNQLYKDFYEKKAEFENEILYSQVFDERKEKENQKFYISEAGNTEWQKAIKTLVERHNNQLRRYSNNFEQKQKNWDNSYNVFLKEKQDWIYRQYMLAENAGSMKGLKTSALDSKSALARSMEGLSITMEKDATVEEISKDVDKYVDGVYDRNLTDNILGMMQSLEYIVKNDGRILNNIAKKDTDTIENYIEAVEIQKNLEDDMKKEAAKLAAEEAEKQIREMIKNSLKRIDVENESMWNWEKTMLMNAGYLVTDSIIERESIADASIGRTKFEVQTVHRYQNYVAEQPVISTTIGFDGDASSIMLKIKDAQYALDLWQADIFGDGDMMDQSRNYSVLRSDEEEADGDILALKKAENDEKIKEYNALLEKQRNLKDGEKLDSNYSDRLADLSEEIVSVRGGKFGEYLGYAPVFDSKGDIKDGKNENIKHEGKGEIGAIMTDFIWNDKVQTNGNSQFSLPPYEQKLWISDSSFDPPSIKGLASLVVDIAGAVTGCEFLGLLDDALFGALDFFVAGKDIGEVALDFGKAVLSEAIGAGLGAAGKGLGSMLDGAGAVWKTVGTGAIEFGTNYLSAGLSGTLDGISYSADDGWDFDEEAMKKSWYSSSTIGSALVGGLTAGIGSGVDSAFKAKGLNGAVRQKIWQGAIDVGTSFAGEGLKLGIHKAYAEWSSDAWLRNSAEDAFDEGFSINLGDLGVMFDIANTISRKKGFAFGALADLSEKLDGKGFLDLKIGGDGSFSAGFGNEGVGIGGLWKSAKAGYEYKQIDKFTQKNSKAGNVMRLAYTFGDANQENAAMRVAYGYDNVKFEKSRDGKPADKFKVLKNDDKNNPDGFDKTYVLNDDQNLSHLNYSIKGLSSEEVDALNSKLKDAKNEMNQQKAYEQMLMFGEAVTRMSNDDDYIGAHKSMLEKASGMADYGIDINGFIGDELRLQKRMADEKNEIARLKKEEEKKKGLKVRIKEAFTNKKEAFLNKYEEFKNIFVDETKKKTDPNGNGVSNSSNGNSSTSSTATSNSATGGNNEPPKTRIQKAIDFVFGGEKEEEETDEFAEYLESRYDFSNMSLKLKAVKPATAPSATVTTANSVVSSNSTPSSSGDKGTSATAVVSKPDNNTVTGNTKQDDEKTRKLIKRLIDLRAKESLTVQECIEIVNIRLDISDVDYKSRKEITESLAPGITMSVL